MATWQFNCSNCGELITVTIERPGGTVYCPQCQAELILPKHLPEEAENMPATAQTDGEKKPEPGFAAPLKKGGKTSPYSGSLTGGEKEADAASSRYATTLAGAGKKPDSGPTLESGPSRATEAPEMVETQRMPGPGSQSVPPPAQEVPEMVETQTMTGPMFETGSAQDPLAEFDADSDFFLPFTENELYSLMQSAAPETIDRIESIPWDGSCWPYAVFAILLETRIEEYLPELAPLAESPTTYFGDDAKYLKVLREEQLRFLEIIANVCAAFGLPFQLAVQRYDIYSMATCLNNLSQPLNELHEFFRETQQVVFPKKPPFPELRQLLESWHNECRYRLLVVAYRLEERSHLTPRQARLGTINVSIIPATIHEFNMMLQTVR